MTWVKIEDKMPSNLKVRGVSVAARWAYVASICYAGGNLTDGLIPRNSLPMVDATPKIAGELVGAGLWEPCPAGWIIHDFRTHQRTRDKVLHRSKVNSENASKSRANRSTKTERNANESHSESPYLSSSSYSTDPIPLHVERSGTEEAEKQIASESPLPDDGAVFRFWEDKTGVLLNPTMADDLDSFREKYPEDWVLDAIVETARQGKRSTKYTAGILTRWDSEGRHHDSRNEPQKDTLEDRKARYLG